MLSLSLVATAFNKPAELSYGDWMCREVKGAGNFDGMLRLLVVAPVAAGIVKQRHQSIDLVLGRTHVELTGLDAD